MRERFRGLAVKAVMMTALLVAPAELLAVPAKGWPCATWHAKHYCRLPAMCLPAG